MTSKDAPVSFGIREEHLKAVKAMLAQLYRERLVRVVLFGSAARGEAHGESDVDVLVVLRGPVDPYVEARRLSEVMLTASLTYGLALSLLPVSEERYEDPVHPLMRNVREEGLEL